MNGYDREIIETWTMLRGIAVADVRVGPRRRRGPVVCVGIDLAGVEHRETGVAFLRDGRLKRLTSASTDEEIVALVAEGGRAPLVAINAPLTRPLGRCCLDDDCPCRQDPGTRSRQLERDLGRLGVPTLATALIKVLARRGARVAETLRTLGHEPFEVYPFATLRLLGLPCSGKRTEAGRGKIYRALRPLVPGLRHPRASEHQLDAVVCAFTAHLSHRGLTVAVGRPEEGTMTIPDPTKVERAARPVKPKAARPASPAAPASPGPRRGGSRARSASG